MMVADANHAGSHPLLHRSSRRPAEAGCCRPRVYFEPPPEPLAPPLPAPAPVPELLPPAPELPPLVSLDEEPLPMLPEEVAPGDEELEPLGDVLEDEPEEPLPMLPELLPDELLGDVALLPEEEPELMPEPVVPHAASARTAAATGIVHFNITFSLKINR